MLAPAPRLPRLRSGANHFTAAFPLPRGASQSRLHPGAVASGESAPADPAAGLRVAASRFGQGLFATRAFNEEEAVLCFSGPLLSLEQVIAKGEAQANPLPVDDRDHIDIGDPGVVANHSCRPNAGIRRDVDRVALRPIQPGQAICWDDSTAMWEDDWVKACAAGWCSTSSGAGFRPPVHPVPEPGRVGEREP